MILYYLALTVICVLTIALFHRKVDVGFMVYLFVGAQLALTVHACANLHETELVYFSYDAIGVILLVVLSIVTIPAIIHSRIYMDRHRTSPSARATYYSSLLLLIMAMSLGYLANHIAMTWVFTEITTLSAAMLVYHHRNKLALEGTWKYIFVCAISVTFIFIGILFLSLSLMHAGSNDLSYANLLNNSANLDVFWLKLAFIFIFTGYTAKMGLFPMFTAGIDAKDKAPSPAGALLAAVLVNLGFIGIFRSYSIVSNTSVGQWSRIFMIAVALITLFVATAYMIKVRNIKRLLAYSGIEQMAIVILGMALGRVGCYAAILHLVMHSFIKSGLFFHLGQLFRVYKSKMIENMGGYFSYNPFGALVLLLGLFCITAIPPSGLFISEFMIFKTMIASGQYWLFAVVALLLTVLIWAFARIIFRIVFIPQETENKIDTPHISPWESATQIVLFLLAIYIGYGTPSILVNLINEAITVIS
ncbi:MAG: proton-conducting transporter membrane subunit [Bacteroidales bacterium]|nr:proton-conducting transporter membrane subunit [Bacteroidales bacterium]MDD4670793.1 proton-conducting transporter membrane subunit [Bacteroidales bacterium]